jgi:hypothetical protein
MTGSFDPNTRFGKLPVTVAPSPATSGTSLTVDVHGDDPFTNLVAPYYALISPAVVDSHAENAETVLGKHSGVDWRVGMGYGRW